MQTARIDDVKVSWIIDIGPPGSFRVYKPAQLALSFLPQACISSLIVKMRNYISVFWLLASLLTSLGFVNASGPTTSEKPGFIKAPGRTFTLDGE